MMKQNKFRSDSTLHHAPNESESVEDSTLSVPREIPPIPDWAYKLAEAFNTPEFSIEKSEKAMAELAEKVRKEM